MIDHALMYLLEIRLEYEFLETSTAVREFRGEDLQGSAVPLELEVCLGQER